MIDLSGALLKQVSVHQIGNKAHEEGFFLSEQPIILDEALQSALLDYCSRTFSKVSDVYQFVHKVDMSYHVMAGLSKQIFADAQVFHDRSRDVVQHLYDQSTHPHIKSGDVMLIRLENVLMVDELVNAIVLIKAENKEGFLKLSKVGDSIQVDSYEGIQLKRMDKGALILEMEEDEGYRVLTVDNNNYDASYWLEDFLGIDFVHDHNFDTKAYVEMCKSFAQDVIKETVDKKTQVDFVQQTFQYIDQVDTLEIAEFKETMFADEAMTEAFDQYSAHYEKEKGAKISDSFEVSQTVMKKQKQKLRNFIKLDTNIKIQLGFSNAQSVDRFIEKGFDEEKNMYYYKCYFNTES